MVKMIPGEGLKNYVSYFQSQMALVYICNEDVAATTFINGLQVTHLFYKHLVKNNVTKMRDIPVRAHKYMQIRDDSDCHQLPFQIRTRGREAEATVSPKEESEPQRPLFTNHPGVRSNPAREAKQSSTSFHSGYLSTTSSMPSKMSPESGVQADHSQIIQRELKLETFFFHDGRGHITVQCHTL